MSSLPALVQKYIIDSGIDVNEFTSQEKLVLNKIISEINRTGKSNLLESLYLEDYEEIPISFDEFVENPFYLGGSTDNGNGIWSAWRKELRYIFNPLNKIYLSMLSGAIGIGKSTIACFGVDYIIYKLLCLKNPAKFYKLLSDSKPGIALFNITLSKGYGVAFDKINTALKKSPWFLKHGSVIGTTPQTQVFVPDKDIIISVGSNADHFIGTDVFCLTGDVKVVTDKGILTLEKLSKLKETFRVASLSNEGTITLSDYTCCMQTQMTNELYVITLDNGYIIKGTDQHKLLLSKQRYKKFKNIVVGDEIYGCDRNLKVIKTNKLHLNYLEPMYDIVDAYPYNNFLIDTDDNYIVSHNCMMMDEVDFKDTKEVELTKMKSYEAWTAMFRRMESRFMDMGQIPGMAFLVSSAKTEDAFLSQMKEIERGKTGVYILEKPQWEMLPKERFCGKTFHFAISNKAEEASIITDEELESISKEDFDVLEVPIEYYDTFMKDPFGAMRDIIGKASKLSGKFLIKTKVDDAIDTTFKNCFSSNMISLGELQDGKSLVDYIELKNINTKLIHYPLFIHQDLSLGSADCTGFYITAVANNIENDVLDEDNNTQYNTWKFIPVGWCRIRAEKKGAQIPLYKIREGVRELRDKYGFNILAVSADGYQSADMLQQYQLMGFTTFLISMDRAPSDGYMFFRSSLYSNKIILPQDDFLYSELTHLLENRTQGKIDHPVDGSKDLADACAGSIYCSIKYNEKAKQKIFADGGFLLSDIITGTQDKDISKIITKETNNAIQDIKNSLFNSIPSDDEDEFSIF